MATIRAFLAVLPAQRALAEVARCMQRLAAPVEAAGLKVGWVRSQGLHVTLKFFGDIDPDRPDRPDGPDRPDRPDGPAGILAMQAALAPLRLPAPAIGLAGLGAFPSLHRPRVLFAGITGADALSVLYENVERVMTALGHTPDDRPFHPHLTLGRVRSFGQGGKGAGERLARVLEPYQEHVFGAPEPVRELILFESRQGQYVPRMSVPLQLEQS